MALEEAVRFPGQQSNVAHWLALTDVNVLPSLHEGLRLLAIESPAVGHPVVATAVDSTPEIVIDGNTELTIPPSDPGLLAEAVRDLLHNPDLRCPLSQAGRKWVLENFTQEWQSRQTKEFYFRAFPPHCHRSCSSPTVHNGHDSAGNIPVAR